MAYLFTNVNRNGVAAELSRIPSHQSRTQYLRHSALDGFIKHRSQRSCDRYDGGIRTEKFVCCRITSHQALKMKCLRLTRPRLFGHDPSEEGKTSMTHDCTTHKSSLASLWSLNLSSFGFYHTKRPRSYVERWRSSLHAHYQPNYLPVFDVQLRQ
jgi:hypothetical protein